MGATIYNDPVDSAKSWESLDEAVNTEATVETESNGAEQSSDADATEK